MTTSDFERVTISDGEEAPSMTIVGSTISGNTASSPAANERGAQGALTGEPSTAGTMTIVESTISGNTAGGPASSEGEALRFGDGDTVFIIDARDELVFVSNGDEVDVAGGPHVRVFDGSTLHHSLDDPTIAAIYVDADPATTERPSEDTGGLEGVAEIAVTAQMETTDGASELLIA